MALQRVDLVVRFNIQRKNSFFFGLFQVGVLKSVMNLRLFVSGSFLRCLVSASHHSARGTQFLLKGAMAHYVE